MTSRIHKIFFVLLLLVGGTHLQILAQVQNKKIADIVEQLPAQARSDEDKFYKALIASSEEELAQLMAAVVPNGMAAGVKARYAVSLLTHTATSGADKAKIEKVYLAALGKAPDVEVKAYLIDNLKLVGGNATVVAMKNYLDSKDLFEPAVSAMLTIGGEATASELLATLKPSDKRLKVIKALGQQKIKSAVSVLTPLAKDSDPMVRKQALWSLAMIGDASSYQTLKDAAKGVGYKNDHSEATVSLVEYLHQQTLSGNASLSKEISNDLLAATTDPALQHIRLTALSNLVRTDAAAAAKVMIKESSKPDREYQLEVIKLSAPTVRNEAGRKLWLKEFKKATGARQADILGLLSTGDEAFVQSVTGSLKAKTVEVRTRAAAQLALTRDKKFIAPLTDYLLQSTDTLDVKSAEVALLQLSDKTQIETLIPKLAVASNPAKLALIRMFGARNATASFKQIATLTASTDPTLRAAAFAALPKVAAQGDVIALIDILRQAKGNGEVTAVQQALIAVADPSNAPQMIAAYQKEKLRFLPIMPFVADKSTLPSVLSDLQQGSDDEKKAAFTALLDWQNKDAIRPLLTIVKDDSKSAFHAQALEGFINMVTDSDFPDDQKLLLIREAMPYAKDKKEKSSILKAAGNVRTFLALVFVSGYLDDKELSAAASRSAMQIALPTSDARPGLEGSEVRVILNQMLNKLTGADSQYERIDILTYLEKMPATKGFQSIFNGKDLTGWQGLVENPVVRSKMTKAVLAKKQKEADAKVSNNWNVKDGMIVFQGDGANLCTTRPYGDFELIVDWKISKDGDSGIYLRGSPQVQIWDTTRRDVGAQVGSGGLYNNQKERSTPLVVADNPIGEWNTFFIRMVGDRVTVKLNGVLVVDNVILENYWDRKLPIFAQEAIELQAHGTDLAFRNLYVKELNTKPYELTAEEKTQGYELLFNGKDLNNWVGNKVDYMVEDNTIAIYPGQENRGNLYTEKEFSNFVMRFDFQLTPGANNGLGIHAPLEGDAAYVGKEIQILDNTSPKYEKLQVYQFHGSVYGVMPAKKGYLNPVGDWNTEEVYVKGDYIKVTLNGAVILEGDMKKATAKGTLDHKDHPGLQRHTGHIGFLGHGDVVKFRNLRIKTIQ